MTPQFKAAVETYGARFMADLGLEAHQVAGIFGNFAVESDQFRALQEYNPTVKGSRGGWGWAQWTGPRRRQFEAWADKQGLKRDDPEGFYAYTLVELRGPEAAALRALKQTRTVDAAAESFMRRYERPGVPHLDKRKALAREAMGLLVPAGASNPSPVAKKATTARPAASAAELSELIVRAIQRRLIALGYHDVGLVDGKIGPKFENALRQLQQRASDMGERVSVDGRYGPQTQGLLDEAKGDRYKAVVSEERRSITASDLAAAGTPAVTKSRKIVWSSVGSVLMAAATFGVALVQGWQTQPDIPWYAQTVMGFLPPWVLPVVIVALNLYNTAKAQGLISSAVERVREGIDNPGPTTNRPGGIFGQLFGR